MAAAPASSGAAATPLAPVHYWLVTISVMCASLVQFLDQTIANVAIPHMQASLDASPDTVTWVLTSFIVASAVAIPAAGWVASRFGTRRPFLLSLATFVVASMLCGIAANLAQMVLFRSIQGVAAAFIAPLAQAILLDITPTAKHTRALSMWGMTSMLGPIIGPTLGGWLTDSFSWRWVFYINAPVGIPAMIVLLRLLPDTSRVERKFDLTGYVFLALAVASLQLMLDRGGINEWFASAETWIECGVSLSAFWIFLIHSRLTRVPLFPRELVGNPRVLLSAFFSIVTGCMLIGIAAILPTLFQNLYGYSVEQTGLVMAPRGIGIFMVMMFIPRILSFFSLRVILTAGFGIASLSLWQMTRWTLVMPGWELSLSAFTQGVGMGILLVPTNFIAFSAVPTALRTDCAGFLSLVRSLAGSSAISLLVVFLTRSTQIAHSELAPFLDPGRFNIPPAYVGAFGSFDTTLALIANGMVNRQAVMIAYLNVFDLLFLLSLAVLPICILVRGRAQAS